MHKILIIQTAFLGDAILTLPMLQYLSEKYPNSIIDVVAIPSTKMVFEHSSKVNKVWIYDKKGKQKSIVSLVKFAKELRKENYSLLFSPHKSFRTSLLVWLSRVKETTGFNNSSFKYVYRHLVEYRKDFHEVRRNLSLVDEAFFANKDWKIKPEIEFDSVNKNKITELLKAIQLPNIVAIAPGSVWETKKYPSEYFAELVSALSESYTVVLIGGEADKEVCRKVNDLSGNKAVSLAGELSVTESIYLLSQCKFLLSNDSAPTHMAMCAGIPVLTIYTSTVPHFGFYPYLYESKIISFDDLECKPCGIHGYKKCPIGTFDCGKKLLPSDVLKSIEKIIVSD